MFALFLSIKNKMLPFYYLLLFYLLHTSRAKIPIWGTVQCTFIWRWRFARLVLKEGSLFGATRYWLIGEKDMFIFLCSKKLWKLNFVNIINTKRGTCPLCPNYKTPHMLLTQGKASRNRESQQCSWPRRWNFWFSTTWANY